MHQSKQPQHQQKLSFMNGVWFDSIKRHPSKHLPLQSQNYINNKDTRTTSMTSFLVSFFCLHFTSFSSIILFCEYCWLWACIRLLTPNLNKSRTKNEVLFLCQSCILIRNVFQLLLERKWLQMSLKHQQLSSEGVL